MKPKKNITRKPESSKGFKLRPHVRISIEDLTWLVEQEPCVKHLYLECAKSEQFGDHPRELTTSLSINSFKKAIKTLQDRGLFEFEPIAGKLPSGKTGVIGYRVKNLHGSSNHTYWRINTEVENIADECETVTASKFDDDDQILTLEDQNLTLTETETLTTASSQFSSQPFSQEKEIKNKEKTACGGPVEKPKLKNQEKLSEDAIAELMSYIPKNSDTVLDRIKEILNKYNVNYPDTLVDINFHWEDVDSYVLESGINKGKYTREQLDKAIKVSNYAPKLINIWLTGELSEDELTLRENSLQVG